MALAELLLLACAGAPRATAEADAIRVQGTPLRLPLPDGWVVTINPENFRSGLPDLVAEGRFADTRVGLSVQPMPGADALGLDSALDRLLLRWPVGPDQTRSLRRLPRCGGAVEHSVRVEDERLFYRYAWNAGDALAILSAWSTTGAPDRDALRALVCGRDE